jgi:HD-like signal output (HDOD) protein
MMLNPRTSAKEVAQLISNDPAITSKILRVVNSSFYGFPQRITTITHAIVILGFNTIRSIVLSSTIFDAFKGGQQRSDGFDRVQFWKHSIACGAAAKVLAKRLGHSGVEEFFIAGLLHDVGKIILDQYLHEQAQKVMDTVRQKDILWVRAEEEVMGVTHAELGGWLFQKWNLSKALVESCTCHHNPTLATDNLKAVSVVHFADIVSRSLMVGSGGDRRMPMLSDTAWQAMDLPPGSMERIVSEADEEIEKAFVFLDFLK